MNNMTMKLKHIFTVTALVAGLAASAQPSEWNVQYIKQKNYGSPGAFNPRKIDIPDIDGYTTLKVDLHLHTVNSDGDVDHDGDYDIPEAYGWLESILTR